MTPYSLAGKYQNFWNYAGRILKQRDKVLERHVILLSLSTMKQH